jgi:hypothetical protein
MGGAFDLKTKAILCNGELVTHKLNQVFRHPSSAKYQNAQKYNTFDRVLPDAQDNWKDLIIAYVVAGVDVGNEWPAWCTYLEQLGTAPQGPLNIYNIAQARYTALIGNVGMDTSTHGGGGNVHTHHGSGASPTTIDSPCPPP